MTWGEQLHWREKIHSQYPEIWDLKIVRKRVPFILRYLRDGESVLEIGAFNRSLEERLRRYYPRILYKSLDIDPSFQHDYTSFEEVREKFDMVLLFEVIEHLDWEGGREMVARIFEILRPGGRVILSTPNIYTPGQYWKDASHRTAYHYEELGGLVLSEGFEAVEIYRLFSEPFLKYFLRVYMFSALFHFLGVDFTKSILLLAKKA
jgi:SAM-dependent methyltransferase